MGESSSSPPSESQKQCARELDIQFSGDISQQSLDLLITARCRELDPSPQWLREVAGQLGVGNRHSTRRELLHLIEAELMATGRVELLVWFLYGVSRHLGGEAWDGPAGSGISTAAMEELAHRLAREPGVMASLKGYLPGTMYRFGGLYGSTDTPAFKAAARVLEKRIDTSARRKEGGR